MKAAHSAALRIAWSAQFDSDEANAPTVAGASLVGHWNEIASVVAQPATIKAQNSSAATVASWYRRRRRE
jgi:hypothetical protein